MSQLSSVTKSWIGSTPVYLTLDGTVATASARVLFETAGWEPVKNTEDQCLEAVEIQQVDVGGASGVDGFEVVLKTPTLRNSVFAKFLAQRKLTATTQPAQFTLAERDVADVERVFNFTKLAWISLEYDRGRGVHAGYCFDVTARLRSVE